MEDKQDLEIRLLKAQIANIELQNRRGLVREAMPSLSAIAFSIVASIVVVMIGDMVVKNAMTKLTEVESNIKKKGGIVADLTKRCEALNELNASLAGKAMLYDLGVDFKIRIEKEGNAYAVYASSNSQNIRFRCFDACKNSFVFPGEAPNASLCQEIVGSCSRDKTKQSCKFGPFLIMGLDEGVWVSAELDGKTVYRYVHIRPL